MEHFLMQGGRELLAAAGDLQIMQQCCTALCDMRGAAARLSGA